MKIHLDTFTRVAALRLFLYAVLVAAAWAPTALLAQVTGNAPTGQKILLVEPLGNTATLNWVAPTAYHDGTPLGTAVLSYTVYAAAPGAPWKAATPTNITARTWTSAPLTVKGPVCYIVTASVLGLESIPSAAVCEQVGVAPAAPGGLTLS